MFTQNDTIHFSCTQCGQCCQKSPEMHFYDMLTLSDEFIFQTAHHSVISYASNPLETELLGHYSAIGHTIVMPEIDASLFYFINFIPVSYPSYKTCPKLENNLCSIYGKRPTSCKLAPLDARFDDTQQWRALNYFKKNVEQHNWGCDFTKKSPIIFQHQTIYNPSLNASYFQSVDSIREFTDKYIDFLGLGLKDYKNEHFKAVFKSLSQNVLMVSDMIIPLQVARYNNLISEVDALTFIDNQIKLIDKEMNQAISLKRKEDLPTTRLYKKQKEDYLRAMKSKIFQDFQQNDFDII